MIVNREPIKETESNIVTPGDIIREAVKVYPDLPHDKAVQRWLSENYPEYGEIYKKISKKYTGKTGIGDVALHYIVTEMVEVTFRLSGTGLPYITGREAIPLGVIMFFFLIGSFFLLITGTLYGLLSFIVVCGAIMAFFLALDRGLFKRKGNHSKPSILFK
jgi:hypothetical protein